MKSANLFAELIWQIKTQVILQKLTGSVLTIQGLNISIYYTLPLSVKQIHTMHMEYHLSTVTKSTFLKPLLL